MFYCQFFVCHKIVPNFFICTYFTYIFTQFGANMYMFDGFIDYKSSKGDLIFFRLLSVTWV